MAVPTTALGKELAKVIIDLGMTRKDLAQELGITREHLSRVMNDHPAVTGRLLIAINAFYRRNGKTFVRPEEQKKPGTDAYRLDFLLQNCGLTVNDIDLRTRQDVDYLISLYNKKK